MTAQSHTAPEAPRGERWDIFISYARQSLVDDWIENHFQGRVWPSSSPWNQERNGGYFEIHVFAAAKYGVWKYSAPAPATTRCFVAVCMAPPIAGVLGARSNWRRYWIVRIIAVRRSA